MQCLTRREWCGDEGPGGWPSQGGAAATAGPGASSWVHHTPVNYRAKWRDGGAGHLAHPTTRPMGCEETGGRRWGSNPCVASAPPGGRHSIAGTKLADRCDYTAVLGRAGGSRTAAGLDPYADPKNSLLPSKL
jgi:hypothetical protein